MAFHKGNIAQTNGLRVTVDTDNTSAKKQLT